MYRTAPLSAACAPSTRCMMAPMGTEIERKFLVTNDDWRSQAVDSRSMAQGYLAADGPCSVRVRVSGDDANINIKSAILGIERSEFEFPIPVGEARALLETFCRDKLVSKTRHYVPYADHTWEIDVFDGANKGLVVAEIELGAVDEAFSQPAWAGREVSNDRQYYNVSLVEYPYRDWPATDGDR